MNNYTGSDTSASRNVRLPKPRRSSKGVVSRASSSGVDCSNKKKSTSRNDPKVADLEPELQEPPDARPGRYKVERDIAKEMCPPDGALPGMLRLQNNLIELERRVVNQHPQPKQKVKARKTSTKPATVRFIVPEADCADETCEAGNEIAPGFLQTVAINVCEVDDVQPAPDEPPTTAAAATEPSQAASHETPEADFESEEDRTDQMTTMSSLYGTPCEQLVKLYGQQCRAQYERHSNQAQLLREAFEEIDAQSAVLESESTSLEEYGIDSSEQRTNTAQRLKLFSPLGPRGRAKSPRTKSRKKDTGRAAENFGPVRQVQSAGSSSPPRHVGTRRKPDARVSTSQPESGTTERPRLGKATQQSRVAHTKSRSKIKMPPTGKLVTAKLANLSYIECRETEDSTKNTATNYKANQPDILGEIPQTQDVYLEIPHISGMIGNRSPLGNLSLSWDSQIDHSQPDKAKRLATTSSPQTGMLEARPISAFRYPLVMVEDCSPDTRKLATYLESRREKILTDTFILSRRSTSEHIAVRSTRTNAASPTEVCYDVSVTTSPRAHTALSAAPCTAKNLSVAVTAKNFSASATAKIVSAAVIIKNVSASCTGDIVSKSLQRLTSKPLIRNASTIQRLLGGPRSTDRSAKVADIKLPKADSKTTKAAPRLNVPAKKTRLLSSMTSELTFTRRPVSTDGHQDPIFIPMKTQLAATETSIPPRRNVTTPSRAEQICRPRSRARKPEKHIQVSFGTPRSRSRIQKYKRSKNSHDEVKQPTIGVLKFVTREDSSTYSPVPQLVPDRLIHASPIGYTTPVQMVAGKFGVFRKTPDCPPPPPNSPCANATADGETSDVGDRDSDDDYGGEGGNVGSAETASGGGRYGKAGTEELKCARVEFRWMDDTCGTRMLLDDHRKASRTVLGDLSSRFIGATSVGQKKKWTS